MRIVLSCGGTGGHITPAIAIADLVRDSYPGAEITFIGGRSGLETRLVPEAGYRLETLPVIGLQRRLTPANLRAAWLTLRSVQEAKRLLRELSPDVVVGTGGYASFPALYAATRLGIPAVAHESNAVPGLTVRMLAPRLDRVWLNFEAAARELPRSSCRVVGNPLPRGFRVARPQPLSPGCRQMVLSFGGSLGARELNRAVLALMERERQHPEIYHLHATGRGEYEAWRAAFEARGLHRTGHMELVPYLSDMPERMATATLVICRAGAMSISELAASGRAAVLVPSPNVTGDHQRRNAQALAEAGAALLVEEGELEGQLPEAVLSLLSEPERRARMERSISRFCRRDCNAVIRAELQELMRKAGK